MRHARPADPSRAARARRQAALVAVTGAVVLAAVTGTASAKEIGGVPTPPPTCSPVTSLGYKGDARVGETSLATVTVSYAVKPCVSGQSVTVHTRVALTADPTVLAYDDPAASLSGKFVAAVTVNTSYVATVTVTDSATGAVVGAQSIFVAARTKPV